MPFYFYLVGVAFVIISYVITVFIFDLLLRGFAPFIPSRPWVVDQLKDEIVLEKERPNIMAFSCGRSGLYYHLETKYPEANFVGVEPLFFPFLVAKAQSIIRRTKTKVVYKKIRDVNVGWADFIYSHLYPDAMEGIASKLKFECRAGTIILSTGFNIPGLDEDKVIKLEDRKEKYDWLSKNQKLFQSKSKKFKKEPKAFFYKIP